MFERVLSYKVLLEEFAAQSMSLKRSEVAQTPFSRCLVLVEIPDQLLELAFVVFGAPLRVYVGFDSAEQGPVQLVLRRDLRCFELVVWNFGILKAVHFPGLNIEEVVLAAEIARLRQVVAVLHERLP
jgi:hypothetical protein